ncbi:hypothetical protein WMY93_026923 [Mugilogobius chulae]|uniref:C-type lectin domain-containing protein n=1 Tax=Mugilogobius chulae TaxID=88201 RepID=A0AAW0MVN1_9GOBI
MKQKTEILAILSWGTTDSDGSSSQIAICVDGTAFTMSSIGTLGVCQSLLLLSALVRCKMPKTLPCRSAHNRVEVVHSFHAVIYKYYVINSAVTKAVAQQYCREHYTDLAIYRNMDDIAKVPINNYNYAWIGLSDDPASWQGVMTNDANSWKWSATGAPSTSRYMKWSPNSAGSTREMCVYIKGGEWYYYGCKNMLNFACFKSTNGSTSKQLNLVEISLTWEEARRYCRQHYTDLAMIEDETENTAVAALKPGVNVWIGLYREPWIWPDGSTVTFQNWKDGQPTSNTIESCAAESSTRDWHDAKCDAVFPFICHKALENKMVHSVQLKLLTSLDLSDPACTARILAQVRARPHAALKSASKTLEAAVVQSSVILEYYFVNTALTWLDAQTYCREHYTDLATFRNTEDIRRVTRLNNDFAWIGLFDDPASWQGVMTNDANSWKWSSTGAPSTSRYMKWSNGNPNNLGSGEPCVYVFQGKWNDYACNRETYFACFKSANSSSSKQINVVETLLTWENALSYCRQHYTDLAMIEDETENTAVASFQWNVAVWIGLYRKPWMWSDGNNSTFRNWASGQPDSNLETVWERARPMTGTIWTVLVSTLSFVTEEHHGEVHLLHKREDLYHRSIWCICLETTAPKMISAGLCTFSLLFSLYTNCCTSSHDSVKLIKFADDTTLIDYLGRLMSLPTGKGANSSSSKQINVVETLLTWENALSYCRQHYTDLAMIEDETENTAVASFQWNVAVWIGLYRKPWMWSDGNNSTFRNWASGQPDSNLKTVWERARPMTGTIWTVLVSTLSFVTEVTESQERDKTKTTQSRDKTETFIEAAVVQSFHTVILEYYFVNTALTWLDAQTYCREHYTDLATFRNTEDMRRVTRLNNEFAWIGLFDDPASWQGVMTNDATSWKWSSTGAPSTSRYMKWTNGNPDNLGYGEPSCVYVFKESGTTLPATGKHTLRASKKPWMWADGNNSTFRNWAYGQPNSELENCVGESSAHDWHDLDCTSVYPFICHRALKTKFSDVQVRLQSRADLSDPANSALILGQSSCCNTYLTSQSLHSLTDNVTKT